MLTYKGYSAHIKVDLAAGRLFGTVLDIKDTITFEGETVAEIQQEFYKSVDAYLALCKEMGEEPDKAFSGRLPLRTTPENHHKIYLAATQAEKSINAWMEEIVVSAAQKVLHAKSDRQGASSLEEYEHEQILARLEKKLEQLQSALQPYLKSDDPESFNHFLSVLQPFLCDRELANLIADSQEFVYSGS